MKLLVLCLLFGAVLDLTTAETPEDELNKPNTETPDTEDPDVDDIAEPESVDETGLTEEPESVDETELSGAEDEDSGARAKRCTYRPGVWYSRGGRRYIYFPYAMFWSQAQRYCGDKHRATLATVHNAATNNLLKDLAQGKIAWIGLFDGANEGWWLWANGERLVYANFCKGEPNNHSRAEHCTVINWSGNKCWNDLNCGHRLHFICEKK